MKPDDNIIEEEENTEEELQEIAAVVKKPKFKKKGTTERIDVDTKSGRDELVDLIIKSINISNKETGKVAYTLDTKEDPSQITDWIPTGVIDLDINISNRPHCGIPAGRITEITGLEGTGKSLLGAHLLAETQARGGVAVFIDTEASPCTEFLEAVGVDLKKMIYITALTVEEIFEHLEAIIVFIRKSEKSKLVTILIDSVAAATTKVENESDHGASGYGMDKARIISKAMRKITNMIAKERIALILTNQLRTNVGAMFGADKWTTSGGKSIAYHSSVRIRLTALKKIIKEINGKKVTVGVQTQAKTVKNRLAPPHKTSIFEIYFDRGIDKTSNWIALLKEYKIIKGGKSPYTFVDKNNVLHDIEKVNFSKTLRTKPELKEELYAKLCDSLISVYKNPNEDYDEEVEMVDNDEDEDIDDE